MMSASETFSTILLQIRSSNLNFKIIENPYAVQIFMKKRFVKEFCAPSPTFSCTASSLVHEVPGESEGTIKELREEVTLTQKLLDESESRNETAQETIALLEGKIQKSESDMQDFFAKSNEDKKVKVEETKILNGVIKKQTDELSRLKNDATKMSKVMKTREKEIYGLETKSDNQLQTIKNLKELSNNLKNSNSKLEKSLKRTENKRIKKEKKTSLYSEHAAKHSDDSDLNANEKSHEIYTIPVENFFDPLKLKSVNTSVIP